MDEQIQHFILQLFFSRNNPKMYSKVVRDMHKAHSADYLRALIAEAESRINTEGLAFVAPAADNKQFMSQVLSTLRTMRQSLA